MFWKRLRHQKFCMHSLCPTLHYLHDTKALEVSSYTVNLDITILAGRGGVGGGGGSGVAFRVFPQLLQTSSTSKHKLLRGPSSHKPQDANNTAHDVRAGIAARRSLLIRVTGSLHARKCDFICAQTKSTKFPAPIYTKVTTNVP